MPDISTNMGLRVWDQTSDLYDHDQLADNWYKVDLHDHTPGRGKQIPAEGIEDGAITSVKLASSLSIGTAQIANNAVTSAKIADGTIVVGDLANNAVETAKIKDGNVTLAKLAAEAWSSSTPALTNGSLGNGTVVNRSVKIGRTVICQGTLVFGSTTSFTGTLGIALPYTAAATVDQIGSMYAYDSSTSTYKPGICHVSASTPTLIDSFFDSGQVPFIMVGASVPFTWATGDKLFWSISYEAAS